MQGRGGGRKIADEAPANYQRALLGMAVGWLAGLVARGSRLCTRGLANSAVASP